MSVKELGYGVDAVCLKSCQVSWVEGEELMNLSVSSNWGKVPVIKTIFKFDEKL
jgi:hypothetical protein